MKFLSLSRPWDFSILDLPAEHAKRIENRSWPPPENAIGQRIALHSAMSFDSQAFAFFRKLGIIELFPQSFDAYKHGVIRGVATIDRVVSKKWTSGINGPDTLTDAERRFFFEERSDGKINYGWVLRDVRRLTLAVEMRGAQGLRELPPLVNAAVEALVENATRCG